MSKFLKSLFGFSDRQEQEDHKYTQNTRTLSDDRQDQTELENRETDLRLTLKGLYNTAWNAGNKPGARYLKSNRDRAVRDIIDKLRNKELIA